MAEVAVEIILVMVVVEEVEGEENCFVNYVVHQVTQLHIALKDLIGAFNH